MTRNDATYWIEKLHLTPHPEGGHYRQTYRSDVILPQSALPAGFQGSRPASTAIYFLLASDDFSAFHRLRSDEMWHFYAGGALVVYVIDPGGNLSEIQLGCDPERGEVLQAVVRAGNWFASSLRDPRSFSLVGCTVSPGFDFSDFELAKREELTRLHPQHLQLIARLTRG